MNFIETNILIQLIGFIAVGFTFAIFQVNKRSKMLLIQMISGLLYTLHYLLLGASTGAAMNFLGVSRSYVYLNFAKNRSPLIPAAFIFIFSTATLLTWQGMISLLPLAGMISGTFAYWQKRPHNIRILALFASIPWLVYNVISGSYPGMLAETVGITSNLIGMYRFDLPKKYRIRLFSEA